jgi:DNA-directed RNA polymerase
MDKVCEIQILLPSSLTGLCRFNPDSPNPVTEVEMRDPTAILRGIVDREISVSLVVASRSVSSDQEAVEMIKVLSKTAVEMNILSVMDELGQTQSMGSKLLLDPLEGIPEAMPVLKAKV